jgi:hypothetical protein
MFDVDKIVERLDNLDDALKGEKYLLDELLERAAKENAEVEIIDVSSWETGAANQQDSSDILSNIYIAGKDTGKTPWYDTIPEPAVNDARTAEELFTKDYSQFVLATGLETFLFWLAYASQNLVFMILDLNVLVTGSEENSHRLLRHYGFKLQGIIFARNIFVCKHDNGSIIHLHFPLCIAACSMCKSGVGEDRLRLSLMRFTTIEYNASVYDI